MEQELVRLLVRGLAVMPAAGCSSKSGLPGNLENRYNLR